MDLRLLEYFLESARQESINKAAEVIHISQPTLSRQLAQLEEQLGVQLFVRGNKGIKLTNEGVLFKRRAQEILDLVGKTEDELRSQEQELEWTITIGCGETKAVARLAELIKGFQKEHPLVRFDLITGNADASQEGMDRGLIDIGLLLEPVNMSKYEFIRLPDPDPWVVILRSDDPLARKRFVTAADLYKRNLIFPSRISIQSELAHWFNGRYEKLHIIATSNLSTNSSILVKQGLGISLAFAGSLPDRDQQILTYRPLKPALSTYSVICWKRDVPVSRLVEAFINYLKRKLTDSSFSNGKRER